MKRIVFIISVIVFLVVANGLIQRTFSLWQKQQIVSQTEEELERVKKENKDLKAQLEVVRQPGYKEEQARDKLFYVKPGEQIVLLPEQKTTSSEVLGENKEEDNWMKWLTLFF